MSKVRYVRLSAMFGATLLGVARILEGNVVDGAGLIMAALSSTNVITSNQSPTSVRRNENGRLW